MAHYVVRFVLILTICSSNIVCSPAMCQVSYRIVDLGVYSNDAESAGKRINNVGQVLMWSKTVHHSAKGEELVDFHLIFWDQGKKYNLGNTVDAGFNDKGQVVCSDTNRQLFLWQSRHLRKLPFSFLGTAADVNSLINNDGVIVGNIGQTMAIHQSVSIWRHGALFNISISKMDMIKNHLVMTDAIVEAINNEGQLLLRCFTNPVISQGRTFLWSHGHLINIGTIFNARTTHGIGLNDRGWVIGNAYSVPSVGYAFLYRNGHIRPLAGPHGFPVISVRAMNKQGEIIGSADNSLKNSIFIWRDGKIFDLTALVPSHSGWQLNEVSGINNYGQIVGTGIHNGKIRAFFLTPIYAK